MKLYIDTRDSEKIVIELDGKRIVSTAKEGKAQKLLGLIDKTLTGMGSSIDKISEIKVNTGPGSFTGLRVGVAVANTIAWTLGIPVNGKKPPITPKY